MPVRGAADTVGLRGPGRSRFWEVCSDGGNTGNRILNRWEQITLKS